jgi:hypothetical protein
MHRNQFSQEYLTSRKAVIDEDGATVRWFISSGKLTARIKTCASATWAPKISLSVAQVWNRASTFRRERLAASGLAPAEHIHKCNFRTLKPTKIFMNTRNLAQHLQNPEIWNKIPSAT